MSLPLSRKPRNQDAKTLVAVKEHAREEGIYMPLPCDLRARIHKQETEGPNSVTDRRLNTQVKKKPKSKKEILEGGLL
jgi:hypothetical protein